MTSLTTTNYLYLIVLMYCDFMQIEVICPTCSPEHPVSHHILKKDLVKCDACETTHMASPSAPQNISIKVVISKHDTSAVQKIELLGQNEVTIGDEFIIDEDDKPSVVQVTSIELPGNKRVRCANAESIKTIWAKVVDEVVVKISLQSGKRTEPIDLPVPGEREFVVGNVEHFNKNYFKIMTIKVRDGALLRKTGKSAKARYIRRMFARLEKST